ncbi:MAG TPA: SLBB domain-containing protein [Gemmatimonadaceae bacterium]|nr:SLBB domain-containing protein [Gemmatimonadaceae bacterium]
MGHYNFFNVLRAVRVAGPAGIAFTLLALFGTDSHAQGSPSLLASRAELTAAAARAEADAISGDPQRRTQSSLLAAAIRQRLSEGDMQVGDRVVVHYLSDVIHRDTLVVRSGRVIELQGMSVIPVSGLLRSEVEERISSELLKYVKAQQIEVTPLMRVGILGAVTRPGYFAFPSDIPLTDAIMGAGGPTATADFEKSTVRRRNQEFRSADETRRAIAGGLTLDQFGLTAGDEVMIGQRRDISASLVLGMAGAVASILAVVVTMQHR